MPAPETRGGHETARFHQDSSGGAAVPWQLAVRAQQSERARRIGVLLPAASDDAEFQARFGAFLQGLGQWAGASARTCASTPAGPAEMASRFAGTRRSWSRLHPRSFWPMARRRGGIVADDPQRTDRVPGRRRSGWRRLCRKPCATGRQRHRVHEFRIQHGREMAGAAQADRAGCEAGSSPS